MSDAPVFRCQGVGKRYRDGSNQVQVLQDLSFELQAGEKVAIVGSSGSGKSTLLNLLAGLDNIDTGTIEIEGRTWADMKEAERAVYRNRHLGFVYQFHHLLPEFSALENVAMPLLMDRVPITEINERAARLLQQVGLGQRLSHKPAQLSGGERQRVAIARALVAAPRCVLMDEPTGNLDEHTAEDFQQLLLDLNASHRISLVIVTHDMDLARRMDTVYRLHEGILSVSQE